MLDSSSVVIMPTLPSMISSRSLSRLIDDQNPLGGVPRGNDFLYVDENFGKVVIENFLFESGSNASFGDIVKFLF